MDHSPSLLDRVQQLEQGIQSLKAKENESLLLDKVLTLEKDILTLKSRLQPPSKPVRFGSFVRFYRWSVTNWTFLAFMTTLFIAGWVYYKYGVGYFEQYRNISVSKEASKTYQAIGDRLLLWGEFKAAEEAYKTSLEINPYNIDARYGLLRTQVLNPEQGKETYTPEVVDARLKVLSERFKDDYIIPYYYGALLRDRGLYKDSRKYFEDSKRLEPSFLGNYQDLAFIDYQDGDVDAAIKNLEFVRKTNPNNTLALNNLGSSYLVVRKFPEAIEYLKKAREVSPRIETLIDLGDAYRYLSDFDNAILMHEAASKILDSIPQRGVHYGVSSHSFMPLKPDDKKTFKTYVQAQELKQYKALVKYALSIDYCLRSDPERGDLNKAHEAFEEAYHSDQTIDGFKEYACLFNNRVAYINNFMNPNGKQKKWFADKLAKLNVLKFSARCKPRD